MAQIATNGNELTPSEELVVQAIAAGTYFVYNITPTGVSEGSTSLTLPSTPNPALSLELRKNGQVLKAGGVDYTLSSAAITLVIPLFADDILTASYSVSPV